MPTIENHEPASSSRRQHPSKGELQKRAILDAFRDLLAKGNFLELSVADIATAAGINRSNFYFYFESKYEVLGDLVAEVWDIWIERTGGVPRRAHESIEDYHDRLTNASYSTWVDHDAVMIAGMQAVSIDVDIRRRWSALLESFVREYAHQIEMDALAGVAQPCSSDYVGLATVLNDMSINAYYQDRLVKPEPSETRRMLENLRSVAFSSAWGIDPRRRNDDCGA
ncbi:AcrR family transcriptional regulator [Rhodococcus erythropolis]|uniref:TetR/AcrR family transcriptional regulator n=1 Tax=Rhodococcus TaxID=1827 RepID=UPI0015623F01|nr:MULTISPECIES: TetR/AcrR family transcriptional regulator [Rhodococcus]MCS4252631.1 AcrR family transcriptional regulator [Rhodococcus erythropolis]NRH33637.1 TetR/AcrR family transcriptional regulator [Rhodococcus sp. MS13]